MLDSPLCVSAEERLQPVARRINTSGTHNLPISIKARTVEPTKSSTPAAMSTLSARR